MKKVPERITCGDLKAVRKMVALTSIAGEWTKYKDHYQFRAETGAVLNYWKTTGTINFQGPELPAAELKFAILKRAIVLEVPASHGESAV